ncbi:MmyB family transcriptional regulator [Streptomyces pinistramenti]|uniref:MmyB family transcriptional regulator n=1 Tax=Streptomyces pinistramenti TaxID=2884812 RepID=UPI001D06C389|nr:helix-turn-helix domain-containing protein [Streptomyces pinistramenti]MCB5905906.1 helix-turn-helix transcriptional regulator [Streptomyces pinistramenti]
MGLGGLLWAWRERASARTGRTITQQEVGEAAGRSQRWYQDVEAGRTVRLHRAQCDAIGAKFLLDHDELQALILLSTGGAILPGIPDLDTTTRRSLQLVLDQQMPHPAWLLDAMRNVVGYNATMASWLSWVTQPGANLMRWALLSEEGKRVILDWTEQAEQYLAMLRFTLFQHQKDPQVNALVSEILSDPYLARRWEEGTAVSEGRGPLRYRASLAAHGWRPVTLECQTLFPAAAPACRMVILVWIDDEDENPVAWDEGMAGARETAPGPVDRAV